MNKKKLLLIWATISFACLAIGIPWFFLYETIVFKCIGIIGILSSMACTIVFAIKADKQAICYFFKGNVRLTDLILHLASKIINAFWESVKDGSINKITLKLCTIICVITAIPAIIIILATIVLVVINFIWGWTKTVSASFFSQKNNYQLLINSPTLNIILFFQPSKNHKQC